MDKFEPVELIDLPDGHRLTLVDVMGDDEAIVDAASISYSYAATPRKSTTRNLIRYLMRHWHTTPFEMVELKFYVKVPIFTARQWIRHRTANINELSGRYSEMPADFFVPEEFQFQSVTNKQGRMEALMSLAESDELRDRMLTHNEGAFSFYRYMVEGGVSKEQARMHLPLGTFTEFVWKIDLHNLMHFCRLRCDPHAQKEIRFMADGLASAMEKVAPLAYEAWVDYRLKAVSLSRQEMAFVTQMLSHIRDQRIKDSLDGWASLNGIGDRERKELEAKLGQIAVD